MNLPLYIARRIGLTSTTGRRSPGIVVGWIGVALSVAIMLLDIFVVNGFKSQIKYKLSGFNAPITINAPEQQDAPAFTSGIRLTDSLKTIIRNNTGAEYASLIIRQPAIFKTGDDFQGIILKGVDLDHRNWQFYKENLVEGAVPIEEDGENVVMISSVTASKLGLKSGDDIMTHFLENGSIRSRRLKVTGIFDTKFNDFDAAFALTNLAMLQRLCHADSITGTAVELVGVPEDQIMEDANRLMQALVESTMQTPGNPMIYRVTSISESCGQYLGWLNLLDTNVVVIIILMAIVASFTLISSLFIIILDKVSTIGLLKALGCTNAQIRMIFIYIAERLVVKGLIIGNIFALSLALLQEKFHFMPLDADAYYLSYVPIEMNWGAVTIVNIAAVAVSLLVLVVPSGVIARMSPSESLRYE
ncbi:MAG: FtsX-like permease family protein [Bacteroides sp.]|nr:FtsX-like permease family protein [Bacteroides sp.]